MIKILIINSTYYHSIAKDLQKGSEITLKRESRTKIKSKTIIVPGIFEIPLIISKNIKKFDAFIALGCVIKGETPHFTFISKTTFDSIMKLSVDYKKPIGNGIITALNMNQATKRSSNIEFSKSFPKKKIKKVNKGIEATRAVLSLLGILKNGKK